MISFIHPSICPSIFSFIEPNERRKYLYNLKYKKKFVYIGSRVSPKGMTSSHLDSPHLSSYMSMGYLFVDG